MKDRPTAIVYISYMATHGMLTSHESDLFIGPINLSVVLRSIFATEPHELVMRPTFDDRSRFHTPTTTWS